MSRVARPSPTSSTPVASGSSVPACPTRRCPYSFRMRATTSCDVCAAGLSTTTSPSCKATTLTPGRAAPSECGEDALHDDVGGVVAGEAGCEAVAAAAFVLSDAAHVDGAERAQADAPRAVVGLLQDARHLRLLCAAHEVDHPLDLLERDTAPLQVFLGDRGPHEVLLGHELGPAQH